MSDVNTHHFPHGDILVVDDNTSDLRFLSSILREAGYTVRPASDGELALRSVQARLPDLILLDIKMPGLDSYEVCRRLKATEDTRDIPVIFVSAKTSPMDKVKAFGLCCVDYIPKPFDPQEVLARVATHLALWKAQKEVEEKNLQLQQEIAEHKQAEEARRVSEERYRSFVQNLDGIAYRGNANFEPEFFHGAVEKMTGYTEQDFMEGKIRWDSIIHEDDWPGYLEKVKERIQDKPLVAESEFRIVHRNGSIRWIHEIFQTIFDDSGQVIGSQGIQHDITERKRAEEALRDSQRMLQTILDSIPSTVFWKDRDSIYLGANRALLKMAGLRSSEEIVGKSDYDLPWGKKQADSFREDDRRVMESGIPEYDIIEPHLRADGTHAWARTNKVPLRNTEGKVMGVLGTSEDITERKRAEEALRESEERYRRIVETAYEGIWIIDAESKTIFANRRIAEMLGYTVDEMMGKSLFDFMDEQWKAIAEVNVESRREGIVEQHDFKFRRKDGTELWTIVTANPFFDKVGRYASALGMITDITERKRAEEALRKSQEGLARAQQIGHLGNWDWDVKNQMLVWSDEVYRIFGVGKEFELTYERIEAMIHPDDREKNQEFVNQLLTTADSADTEFRMVRPDGTVRHIYQNAEVLRDKAGNASRIFGIMQDITERKAMEQQLRQQERLAAVGQLSAGIAHDFRNLLATIILYAQMDLNMPDLPPRLANHLRIITEESNKAADLVQQILDFSSRAPIERRPLDLRSFTEGMLDVLRRTIPENVRLSLEAEAQEDERAFTVRADRGRIQQALTNLALNARDAMPEGGDLQFALSRLEPRAVETRPVATMAPGPLVCLAVSDTGTGMTEEVQEHLFEPFFTTKEVDKGTGLGLAQVYGIVRQHDGAIDVETAPGQGATFRIYLPAYEGEPEEQDAGDGSTSGSPRGQRETILLVEDSERLREAGQSILESLGYHVLTAANGREALSLCQSPRWSAGGLDIDLVITDLVMPEMGGKALMRELDRSHPELKALGITGYAVEDVAEELREAGFLGMIHKPFDVQDLAQAVRRALD